MQQSKLYIKYKYSCVARQFELRRMLKRLEDVQEVKGSFRFMNTQFFRYYHLSASSGAHFARALGLLQYSRSLMTNYRPTTKSLMSHVQTPPLFSRSQFEKRARLLLNRGTAFFIGLLTGETRHKGLIIRISQGSGGQGSIGVKPTSSSE